MLFSQKMTILPCAPVATDADRCNLQKTLSFVLPYEKLAVGFVGRLLREDAPCFLVTDGDKVCDAFALTASGQIFHCLPDAYTERRDELAHVLVNFFRERADCELFDIVGEEKGTDLLKAAIQTATGRATKHEQRYILFEQKSQATMPNVTAETDALAFVQCSPQLTDDLLPLQLAYEKEEVLWNEAQTDENVTRLSLRRALRTQQIFALAKNGAFIAKGGTNARGKNYAQLGGIYTVPAERGKGYATRLVQHITAELRKQGKKSVLFVKPQNEPALRLYKTCGFVQIGRFEIAYF